MIKINKGMIEIKGAELVVKAEFMTLVGTLLEEGIYTKEELTKDLEIVCKEVNSEKSNNETKEDFVKSLHQIIDEVFDAEDKENK